MTRPSTLAALVDAGLLQRKPPDVRRVAGWLVRSQKDLELARDVLAGIDRDRAMAVAYEAGYRCCAGLLDLAGYRVTSQPGHHRAAIDATTAPRPRSGSSAARGATASIAEHATVGHAQNLALLEFQADSITRRAVAQPFRFLDWLAFPRAIWRAQLLSGAPLSGAP